jgi:site-specific recombinase XerC
MMNKRYLTEAEQRRLLEAAKGSSDPLARRDYWWMRLMLSTGARVQEFSKLTLEQAERSLASGWLVVRPEQRKRSSTGQARAHDYVVTATVAECLRALIAIHQRDAAAGTCTAAEAPLIWGRDGTALSVRSYQARIKQWAKAAGLEDRVSPHWLRHSRGVNIVRRSRSANPLKVVQLALGHANLQTSGIYTQMLKEDFVQAMHAVDGARMPRAQARAAELRHQANQQGGAAL